MQQYIKYFLFSLKLAQRVNSGPAVEETVPRVSADNVILRQDVVCVKVDGLGICVKLVSRTCYVSLVNSINYFISKKIQLESVATRPVPKKLPVKTML